MTDFPPVLPYPVVSTSAWVTGFSYIVYQETIGGTLYFMAKNGLTGSIDYGGPSDLGGAVGTDPSAVINAAITAINALGGGIVDVKEGTYVLTASVVVLTNVALVGTGVATYLNGGITGIAISVTGDNCLVRDLQCSTTPGGTNPYSGIVASGSDFRVENVFVNGSDEHGIFVSGARGIIQDCYIFDADDTGIVLNNTSCIASNNNISTCDDFGIDIRASGDNSIASNNVINTTGDDGIRINANAENCVVSGNRITGWTNEPIDDDSLTSIVSDNNCDGPVMTSKGCGMATIALAITHLAGDGWIEVPEGTWSEAVTLSDANTILRGQGWGSIIDGGTTGTAVTISGNFCNIRDIQVKTDTGQGNAYNCVTVSGSDAHIHDVFVNGSDQTGIECAGQYAVVTNCYIFDTDVYGILLANSRCIVSSNRLSTIGAIGIYIDSLGDFAVVTGNSLDTTADDGILIEANAENCVVTGNSIISWTNEPIQNDSATSTIADNNAGGPVMTSKGCSLATIALAETFLAGDGWIEVPEGTWSEAVTLSDANTTLRGQGWGSIIDGGTTGHAVRVSGATVLLEILQ